MQELVRYLNDSIASPRLFIKSGMIESVYLKKKETDVLIEGMLGLIQVCTDDCSRAESKYRRETGRVSEALRIKCNDIRRLAEVLRTKTHKEPWIF